MTIIFGDKNTASRKPTKIFKNQELSFVFAQMNAAHCISGQNKWLEAERLQQSCGVECKGGDYSACTPRTGPNARNWLGELPQVHPITRALSGTPPRTGQVAGGKCPNIIGG